MPDYLKHYEQLCSSRKKLDRKKHLDVYYEVHHIVPKSLGGSNELSNLVLLTAKEHFIAHLLLYNHYKSVNIQGESFKKMAFALVSMSSTNKNLSRIKLNSRQYSIIREAARLSRLGFKVLDTINYKKPKSLAHRESIRNARLIAPPRSKETKEKMKQTALSRPDSFSGNYTTVTCPHCTKVGQTNAMYRWHFENCKIKKEGQNA
jgi:hypothetical protein